MFVSFGDKKKKPQNTANEALKKEWIKKNKNAPTAEVEMGPRFVVSCVTDGATIELHFMKLLIYVKKENALYGLITFTLFLSKQYIICFFYFLRWVTL